MEKQKRRKKKKPGKKFDHYFGMRRAQALQSVARELEETVDIKTQHPFLFEGKIVVTPTLFALAIELALKALYCQETKSNRVKGIHDLVDLFEQLGEDTQAELEATFEELGINSRGRLIAEWPNPPSSMIRYVLWENRNAFISWRYPSESSPPCYTGNLDEVLSTIIRTYYKSLEKEEMIF